MTDKINGKITGKELSEGKNDAGEPWTRASFTINDRKYASFDNKIIESFDTGDYVEAEFNTSKDGKYKNIIKMTEASAPAHKENEGVNASVWESKDKRMAKMNGINNAVLIIGIMGQVMPESTKLLLERTPALDLAREFAEQIVKYIYTD
jgi:hypothetical protein